MLGDIEGLTVFDAFAGSGALAFEALSRGAKSALCTDITKEAYDVMTDKVRHLDLKHCKVVRANASGWSDNNVHAVFDLLFLDPPYDDVQENLLNKLIKHVKTSGIYILSWPAERELPSLEGVELLQSKEYGDGTLHFYRRLSTKNRDIMVL